MRYYNSSTGRFISEDPIGFGGRDLNLYRYVGNNAIRFIDPSGLIILGFSVNMSALLGDTGFVIDKGVAVDITLKNGISFFKFTSVGQTQKGIGGFAGLGLSLFEFNGTKVDFLGRGVEYSTQAGLGIEGVGISAFESENGKKGSSFDLFGLSLGAHTGGRDVITLEGSYSLRSLFEGGSCVKQ